MNKQQLFQQALEAREQAYTPYSKFNVGAALVTTDGEVVLGANIENASYGLTNCAERTAFFTARVEKHTAFSMLGVVAASKQPVPPCGACRQVMAEFCEPSMPVYLFNLEGDCKETTVGELLPGSFSKEDME
ncbi:cytidine deaminase [Aureibacillus halotolerans]|uniref:Cytidine deaminase n=1 Tax=Aureibacillus halotolerans TaxID=1508390 RepID=A0A4R6U9R1_9BACI|nr:cytidine deaminase [Aureibacillus halotolerans]TDQ41733.1 cytidine deaminase [Aureibacillus halotolerans]